MIDTQKARCVIRVFKDGLLATVGHDLLLEVKDFHLTIKEDRSVEAECRTDSVEVVGAVKNGAVVPGALSPEDLRTIKSDMQKQVLECDRYPKAAFRSTSVTESGGRYRIAGFLTLHGSEQRVELSSEKGEGEAVAKLTVNQPTFGIKPYRAMLGALKIKPDVIVEVTVPVT